ncbi:MAG: nitrous oxide reductase family maturation protein NosD [Thermomicrobiales bacterium]|nr:nitrous oxide reductase family maturation protein NosD [Thermomicrobiales bacterium]MCO5218462.1 nitrous oxide reductase family maturation protein NosD [Thermomicrobiales bacterium]MCO5223736.1 nitrous oxide reductase family maturation protein NosD [Thermomicrobiales bacterium]MCO5228568.1 nitrous oxide reductase family maturation protein NosD [Thermomicrobiales bacterium]
MSVRRVVLVLAAFAVIAAGMVTLFPFQSSSASGYGHEAELVPTDPVPADAIRVCESCDLQQVLDDAPENAVVVVEGGSWSPVTISTPLRLVGIDWPIIDAEGKGSGIVIDSPDVTVEGFDIRNTGRSFDKEDSGVYFEGERVRVLNNRLTEVLFGVNGAIGHDSEIAGNYITGQEGVSEGLRGDAIKVWYSHRVQIHHNRVDKSRDLLVWYSNECDVYENIVTNSRYGFHFMNSDDGNASRNAMANNSVGIYIMYGKHFTVEDNLLQSSRGPSGHGIGLKEVDGFAVRGNVIYDNRIGIYNDNSPYSIGEYGIVSGNVIAYNDSGVGVLPSSRSTTYFRNSFVENLEQVTVLGGGPLSLANAWSQNNVGNYWSDYTGYDADGDGIGDIPYRNGALTEQIRRSHPQLQLFRFSLAETAVDFAAQAVPLFEVKSILEDQNPLVRPPEVTNAPEVWHEQNPNRSIGITVLLLVGVGASMWWAMGPSRDANTMTEQA